MEIFEELQSAKGNKLNISFKHEPTRELLRALKSNGRLLSTKRRKVHILFKHDQTREPHTATES